MAIQASALLKNFTFFEAISPCVISILCQMDAAHAMTFTPVVKDLITTSHRQPSSAR